MSFSLLCFDVPVTLPNGPLTKKALRNIISGALSLFGDNQLTEDLCPLCVRTGNLLICCPLGQVKPRLIISAGSDMFSDMMKDSTA